MPPYSEILLLVFIVGVPLIVFQMLRVTAATDPTKPDRKPRGASLIGRDKR